MGGCQLGGEGPERRGRPGTLIPAALGHEEFRGKLFLSSEFVDANPDLS